MLVCASSIFIQLISVDKDHIYVNMRDDYVDMRLINVNMLVNCVNMQDICQLAR